LRCKACRVQHQQFQTGFSITPSYDCGSDTKKETKVRIEQSSGLSKDEIEKMKRDAEAHADEDKQRRELVEAKNNAESMCFQMEKLLKEHDAVSKQTDKDAINSAIGQVQESISTDDLLKIKSATEPLEQASHAMSKAMYESAAVGTSAKSDDDAIDAEFEVKK
jgi:molecular chaperone DnaK